jgi:hypothetical protein
MTAKRRTVDVDGVWPDLLGDSIRQHAVQFARADDILHRKAQVTQETTQQASHNNTQQQTIAKQR